MADAEAFASVPVKRIDRNLAVALAGSICASLVSLVVIPLYVRFLGFEGYGLLGFLATCQALVQVLDLGMTATINREVARNKNETRNDEIRSLLRMFALVYWIVAGAVALAMLAGSRVVAEHWLNAEMASISDVTASVVLVGIIIGCRWPGQLYQASLMGAERLVLTSSLNFLAVLLSQGGSIVLLLFFSGGIHSVLIWQAIAGLGQVLILRSLAWRQVGRPLRQINAGSLRQVWRFSAGVSVIAASGVLLSQLDKVLLSRLLPLAEFGQYMLAFAIASILYLISTPIFNVIYPRFASLSESKSEEHFAAVYRLATQLATATLFPCATFLAIGGRPLIQFWTGSTAAAEAVAAILPALAGGTALHGLMHVPYAMQLAKGATGVALKTSFVLVLLVVPITTVLASRYGAAGGAVAWLLLHSCYLVIGATVTHRSLLRTVGVPWIFLDVGLPALICFVVWRMVVEVERLVSPGPVATGALAVLAAIVASLVCFLQMPLLRTEGLARIRRVLDQLRSGHQI